MTLLLRKSTVLLTCLMAIAPLFIAPGYAKPDDYSFEVGALSPSGSIVTMRLKNNAKGQLVPDAYVDCAADVGPQDVTTMTEAMIAQPGLNKGEYVLVLEPGMQLFDVDLVAQVPGETEPVTGKIHLKNQGGQ